MSCLKANIRPVSGDLKASCKSTGGLKAVFRRVRDCMCCALKASARILAGLVASAKVINDCSVSIVNKNTPVTVRISLICDVGLETECYLQVLEGDLITIDGCYLKVMKA